MTTLSMHEHEHDHDHRTETIQLWIKTALLIGLGVYFTYNIVSGNLANYINERFAWLSYVAAALFLLIGLFSAIHLLRDRGHAHHHDDHHDHDHAQISWRSLAIIAVPLVLGTLIPSRPLGAEAVGGSISTSTVAISESQTFSVPPEQRNVLDWLRAFNSGTPSQFEGQPANLIGFVYTEPTFGEDQFMVARFTVSCCVADASAIGVPVAWDGTESLAQGDWIEVKGTFSVAEFDGDEMPVLHAESVAQVAQPEHPYLYP